MTVLASLPIVLGFGETNWTPGVVVVVLAIVVAVALIVTSRKTAPVGATNGVDPRALDLERKAQQLVDQLRELTADKHQLTAEDFESKRNALELKAAAALRAKDEYASGKKGGAKSSGGSTPAATASASSSPTKPAPMGFWARNPQLKGAVWGALIVGFFAALGIFLKDAEKPRGENGTMTGRDPGEEMGNSAPSARADSQLEAMSATVSSRPDDVEAKAELAHAYILRQRFPEAQALTQQGLALDPFHLESRIHASVLKGTQGDIQGAFKDLEKLGRLYPDAYEAFFFLGAMSMELGDTPRALESLERFLAQAPANEMPPQLNAAIIQLRQQVRGNQAPPP